MNARGLLSIVLVACSSSTAPSDGSAPDSYVADNNAPDVSAEMDATPDVAIDQDQGEAEAGIVLGCNGTYPIGPYGKSKGDTIENLTFQGRSDTNQNGTIVDDSATTVCLAQYHQSSKVRAIAIVGSAMWCAPCQQEEPGLKALFQSYGGEVAMLEVMVQNINFQTPTMQNLVQWATKYTVAHDLGIDANMGFLAYAPQMAFPIHMVVRSKDMKITFEDVGNDLTIFKNEIDAVLGIKDAGSD